MHHNQPFMENQIVFVVKQAIEPTRELDILRIKNNWHKLFLLSHNHFCRESLRTEDGWEDNSSNTLKMTTIEQEASKLVQYI